MRGWNTAHRGGNLKGPWARSQSRRLSLEQLYDSGSLFYIRLRMLQSGVSFIWPTAAFSVLEMAGIKGILPLSQLCMFQFWRNESFSLALSFSVEHRWQLLLLPLRSFFPDTREAAGRQGHIGLALPSTLSILSPSIRPDGPPLEALVGSGRPLGHQCSSLAGWMTWAARTSPAGCGRDQMGLCALQLVNDSQVIGVKGRRAGSSGPSKVYPLGLLQLYAH